jgi:hypothetical protein
MASCAIADNNEYHLVITGPEGDGWPQRHILRDNVLHQKSASSRAICGS